MPSSIVIGVPGIFYSLYLLLFRNSFILEQLLVHTADQIVRIPCEYCNELIDLSDWSIHTVKK
jgi:hypothetical protein